MSAPRKSREVHAEALYRGRDTIMGLTKDEALERVRVIADCVCEEPCRYCRCEPT